ncbi:YkvA family protein [Rubrivivax rivuli]|uniref:DUF1232 domain-containing protein n=1 Tax=Rubrivivax rivuli TaxID=1862385 RepID=A0A437RS65_9BURK|nr:DUF1232 domain-containing protein [Rubrivivax rivuli]RVU49594.1 DUF1232 domain-containing protein [Rubrivivax rivuli]
MWKKLAVLWTLLRSDALQLWRALRHPLQPRWLKPAAALLVLYLLSPIDLLPDFIPLLGVVDDLVLIPLAVRYMLRRLPAAVRADIARGQRY